MKQLLTCIKFIFSSSMWKVNLLALTFITLLCTIAEWYLLGADYNKSIKFNLDAGNFQDGKLGIKQRPLESIPRLRIGCYAFIFVFLLARLAILFYMNGLLLNSKKDRASREEFINLAKFFQYFFLSTLAALGLYCLILGSLMIIGD